MISMSRERTEPHLKPSQTRLQLSCPWMTWMPRQRRVAGIALRHTAADGLVSLLGAGGIWRNAERVSINTWSLPGNKIHDSIRFNNNIVTYYEIAKNNFIGITSHHIKLFSGSFLWHHLAAPKVMAKSPGSPAFAARRAGLDPAWAKLGPGNLVVLPGGPYMPYGAIQCYTGYTCTIYHDLSTCIASLRCFAVRQTGLFMRLAGSCCS
jgi:hypothetical protein